MPHIERITPRIGFDQLDGPRPPLDHFIRTDLQECRLTGDPFGYLSELRPGNSLAAAASSDGSGTVASPAVTGHEAATAARKQMAAVNDCRINLGLHMTPSFGLAVVRICQNLSRATAADAKSSAPVHHHQNVWGGFRFRAEWLDGNDSITGRIAITITHEEPLRIRLTKAASRLELSLRQAEVCVLMASGLSRSAIADRLGIKQNTVREHGRWIYNRLDVHNRSELLGKLLITTAGTSRRFDSRKAGS